MKVRLVLFRGSPGQSLCFINDTLVTFDSEKYSRLNKRLGRLSDLLNVDCNELNAHISILSGSSLKSVNLPGDILSVEYFWVNHFRKGNIELQTLMQHQIDGFDLVKETLDVLALIWWALNPHNVYERGTATCIICCKYELGHTRGPQLNNTTNHYFDSDTCKNPDCFSHKLSAEI